MSAGARADVVITGVGTIGCFGIGLPALGAALAAGTPTTRELADPKGYRRAGTVTASAACSHLDLSEWVSPSKARRMSDPSRFAVAAARMALSHAGLAADTDHVRSVAVATTYGAGVFTERLVSEILDAGPRAASPFLFTDCVANAPAGQIAIDVRALGPNATVVQREAGAVLALIEGSNDVALGRADVALAGHVDEVGALVHAVLARMRALCPADADGQLRPRPFDARRQGFVAGEGATVCAVERADAARARGAKPLARVRTWIRAFDPTAPRAGWGTGAIALGDRLRRELARAGLAPSDIHAVVASASGSVHGDRLEAEILHHVWGDAIPPVFAPKAVTGEYGGGNLGGAFAILGGAYCARPAGTDSPAFGIRLHEGRLPAPAQRILLAGLASGGAAAWIVLERNVP